jgi:hypothetical protein
MTTHVPAVFSLVGTETKPLHVVAALEERRPRVYIITAYEPDLEHFQADLERGERSE